MVDAKYPEQSMDDIKSLFASEAVQKLIEDVAKEKRTDFETDEEVFHGAYCACCSDSRETNPMDVGAAVYMRNPGGFKTEPDGELSDDAALFIERAVEDGAPIVVRQHSRCGAMGIIYAYHTEPSGDDYVRNQHYGHAFAAMAKRRANLYNEVRKHVLKKGADGQDVYDFSYYTEKFGIPLYGPEFESSDGSPRYDDAARFQTCMAIQQGEWCFNKTKEEVAALKGDVPVLFSFTHVAQGGRKYVQLPGQDKFVALPLVSEENFESKMTDVSAQFPQELHERLRTETYSQQEWHAQNEQSKLQGKDMSIAQAPTHATIRSSSTRGDESYESAKVAGESLFLRLPYGFATTGDGGAKFAVAQFAELARAYKVPVLRIDQLEDSEGLTAIYMYNRSNESAKELESIERPRLVRLAKRRAALYTSVKKNIDQHGFAHYEKLGYPVEGTDSQKFLTCMALQQGQDSLKALQNLRKRAPAVEGKILPEPVLFIPTVNKGTYVFHAEKGFVKLPQALAERSAPTIKKVKAQTLST